MLSLIDEWLDHCLRVATPEQPLSQAVPICVQYLLDLNERWVPTARRCHRLLRHWTDTRRIFKQFDQTADELMDGWMRSEP